MITDGGRRERFESLIEAAPLAAEAARQFASWNYGRMTRHSEGGQLRSGPLGLRPRNALPSWNSHSTRLRGRCLAGGPLDGKSPDNGLPRNSLKEGLPCERVSRGANPGTDSQFPANCAGNLASVPGLRRISAHPPKNGLAPARRRVPAGLFNDSIRGQVRT